MRLNQLIRNIIMASRNFSRVQGLNKEVKIIAGRFDDADAKVAGLGFSAANAGTGIYTITLEDKYNALLCATCQVQSTAGTDDYKATVTAEDVDGAKTVTVHVDVAGTLTDLGSGDELHFAFFLQNSATPSV
jgi:hypothetical protein